jgi:thiol-disulfide isomerase/thioredoxin
MKKLLVFTREDCINCSAVELLIQELEQEIKDLVVTRVDADNMNEDLEYELSLNQIFIFATPTIVISDDEKRKMRMFSAGEVPKIEELRFALGGT